MCGGITEEELTPNFVNPKTVLASHQLGNPRYIMLSLEGHLILPPLPS